MGNVCCFEENEDPRDYQFLTTCYKCEDTFYHKYGYSERTSCRVHDFDGDDFCKWCHLYKKDIGTRGCYHIKKTRFWGLCDC